MYQNKLSACIKVNGKVLREDGDQVKLPFGSEYVISITNHETKRVRVNIEIDGNPVSGGGFILDRGNTVDIERSIVNGNLEQGNRFMFIERNDSIEAHRGISSSDGLVKLTYSFESEALINMWTTNRHTTNQRDMTWPMDTGDTYKFGQYTCGQPQSINQLNAVPQSSVLRSVENTAGITAPGSISSQKFQTVSNFVSSGVEHVMVFMLVGKVADKEVVKPLTTKSKLECSMCGKLSTSMSKYCDQCGSFLEVIK